MRKLWIALSAIAIFSVAACTPSPSQPSQSDAQAVADNMSYVQDARTGLCFGVIMGASKTIQGSGSMGVTTVPCDKVKSLLGK